MVIRKTKKGYCLFSKKRTKGKRRNLGCYRTKQGAKRREKQVNYFKYRK